MCEQTSSHNDHLSETWDFRLRDTTYIYRLLKFLAVSPVLPGAHGLTLGSLLTFATVRLQHVITHRALISLRLFLAPLLEPRQGVTWALDINDLDPSHRAFVMHPGQVPPHMAASIDSARTFLRPAVACLSVPRLSFGQMLIKEKQEPTHGGP
jgi:hypothetical protein